MKALLLLCIAGMTVCILSVGAAFYFEMQKGYLVLIAIMAYIAFFAVSLGPLTFVVIAEIFPTRARATAMSVTVFALWSAVFLVSQTFPMLMESIGNAFTFWIYGIMAVFAFVFVWKMVPETKEKPLEEIAEFWKHPKHTENHQN